MKILNNNILIVDDNKSIHEDFQKILGNNVATNSNQLDKLSVELFGEDNNREASEVFNLEFATQGKEALEIVKKKLLTDKSFSMAFIDMRMPPGWDGIKTIKEIWSVDPKILMVICTAFSDYSWSEIIGKLGRSEKFLILKKPFESMEVIQLAYSMTSRWSLEQHADVINEELQEYIKLKSAQLSERTNQLYESEKLASIGVLAGGVAHEFNNINAAIVGYSDLALMQNELSEKVQSYLEKIKASSLRGKTIAGNLLTFAGKSAFKKFPEEPGALIHYVLDLNFKRIEEEGIYVFRDFKSVGKIYCDKAMVVQAISNILSNSIDSLVDIKDKKINISCFADEKFCYITIQDNGKGIPKENIRSIFNPFFSTKGVYSTGTNDSQSKIIGTGLGLSVSQAIIMNHKGDITVKSEVDIGTTLTVKIPLEVKNENI